MVHIVSFAELGALVGDPARANMLEALMDRRALTAKELASLAGVTPQTASGHLAKMLTAGLISMEQHGRHHYHSLASAEVARMLEGMPQPRTSNMPGAPFVPAPATRQCALPVVATITWRAPWPSV